MGNRVILKRYRRSIQTDWETCLAADGAVEVANSVGAKTTAIEVSQRRKTIEVLQSEALKMLARRGEIAGADQRIWNTAPGCCKLTSSRRHSVEERTLVRSLPRGCGGRPREQARDQAPRCHVDPKSRRRT